MPRLRVRLVLLTTLLSAFATVSPAQFLSSPRSSVSLVPWKIHNPGDPPARADLVLEWLPASRDELRRSPLLTSRSLSTSASRCVAMEVIRPDDAPSIARLGGGRLPRALVLDAHGLEVARVESDEDGLSPASVEKMVRDTLASRDLETDRLMEIARNEVANGQTDAAIEAYRQVRDLRCSFPRKARDAERALHKLGVTGKERD
jgi:hypothetical protein